MGGDYAPQSVYQDNIDITLNELDALFNTNLEANTPLEQTTNSP